jgi:hypothetical protein
LPSRYREELDCEERDPYFARWQPNQDTGIQRCKIWAGVRMKSRNLQVIRSGDVSSPKISESQSPLLTEEQAASIREYGGFFTVSKFRRWRLEGCGPVYFKSGEGKKARVFYRRDILDQFILDSMVTPTK